MSRESSEIREGLGMVAHAIRRSAAMYFAIITSPEGTPEDALATRATWYATWIRGQAGDNRPSEQVLGRDDLNFG